VYVAGVSDDKAGISFAPKQRLVQWSQSEGISTSTGAGQSILAPNTYKLGCRMYFQREAFEEVMKPSVQALQKRAEIACVPDDWHMDEDAALLSDVESQTILRDLHSWLVCKARPIKVEVALDEFALAVYDAVAAGFQEFARSVEGRQMSEAMLVKVKFFRSDLLRQCLIVMRIVQYFSNEQPSPTTRTLRVKVALEDAGDHLVFSSSGLVYEGSVITTCCVLSPTFTKTPESHSCCFLEFLQFW
jgi:hypothetical protein